MTTNTPTRPTFTSEQQDRLAGARVRIVSHKANPRPYYSRPLMALSRPIPTYDVPTLGVDARWRLYVNPDFVDRVSSEELAGALVHEINHLIRVHADRAELAGVTPETHQLWNIAGDCEINTDVISEGFVLPEWVMMPEKIGAEPGLLAEAYYRHLIDNDKQVPVPPGSGAGSVGDEPSGDCGSCVGGGSRDHEDDADGSGSGEKGLSESHAEVLRRQTARDITDYANRKGRGTVPGGLLRWAEELLEPKIDWWRVLSSYLRNATAIAAGKIDYTYTRMSRRSTGSVLFPALRQPVIEVAVVVDTSGSMSEEDLTDALTEVEGILRQVGCGGGALSVLTVDAVSQPVQRVTTARRVEVVGGGGTDMRVGIEDALTLRPKPNVIVVLTDGYTPWPAEPPAVPVVAGIIGGGELGVSTPEWMPTVMITRDSDGR